MKSYLMYICEVCGFQDSSREKVFACEAMHHNCTPEEYQHYLDLNKKAERCGCAVYYSNNEQNRKEFDDVCKEIADFEKLHHIIKHD